MLANVKNNVLGTYRAVRPKHVPRYLAQFQWRFNRRFDLPEHPPASRPRGRTHAANAVSAAQIAGEPVGLALGSPKVPHVRLAQADSTASDFGRCSDMAPPAWDGPVDPEQTSSCGVRPEQQYEYQVQGTLPRADKYISERTFRHSGELRRLRCIYEAGLPNSNPRLIWTHVGLQPRLVDLCQ